MTRDQPRDEGIGRREFLVAASSGGLALLAGCSGDGDDAGDGGDGTPDGGNGGGDGDDGEPGSDGGATDTSGGGGGGSASVALSEVITIESSFAMEGVTTSNGQQVNFTGRFAGGDMYLEMEQSSGSFEMYVVDDQSYVVTQGQCLTGSSQGISQEQVDPEGWSVTGSSGTTITSTGTTTIDGTEVYVFELSSAQAAQSSAATYYVETASGHLRRVEAGGNSWNYHSWGQVEPIEKPDMECRSMPDGGGGSAN